MNIKSLGFLLATLTVVGQIRSDNPVTTVVDQTQSKNPYKENLIAAACTAAFTGTVYGVYKLFLWQSLRKPSQIDLTIKLEESEINESVVKMFQEGTDAIIAQLEKGNLLLTDVAFKYAAYPKGGSLVPMVTQKRVRCDYSRCRDENLLKRSSLSAIKGEVGKCLKDLTELRDQESIIRLVSFSIKTVELNSVLADSNKPKAGRPFSLVLKAH